MGDAKDSSRFRSCAIAFLKEAKGDIAEKNKDIKIGYRLTKDRAKEIIGGGLGVINFFEGMCQNIIGMDPKHEHLSEEIKYDLFNRVALNIIQDKKFRIFCKDLWEEYEKT